MSAIAKRSIFLLGMVLLIFLATLWAWSGTAQGATLTVTKTADTDDGVCDVDCSLREAIATAMSGDTINIPTGTYTLILGTELTINTNLTLNGAGPGDTIIQAATSSADATSRVLNITGGTIAISGVTVQNGNTSDGGGGIYNTGTLTLTNSTVSGNTPGLGGGGGILNRGTMTLTNSTISGNTIINSSGGGILNSGTANLSLTNSSVSGNTAYAAGGIFNESGSTLTLTNSAVSGNTAASFCGGIYNNVDALTLTDNTISGNTVRDASGFGGGIANGGTLTIANSTVSGKLWFLGRRRHL